MQSNRKWEAMGLFAALELIRKSKENALQIARIYGATACLKGVHMVRDLFLYQIGILAWVILMLAGVILMEASVIFFIPVETSTRCILVFLLGATNLLIGAIFLGYFISSKRWLRQASKYSAWIKASINEADVPPGRK